MRRIWTCEEDRIVASLYSKVLTSEIAKKLSRSVVAVRLRARRTLGLKYKNVPWNKGKRTGQVPWNKKPHTIIHCLNCGAEVSTIPSRSERTKFCSRKCLGLYLSKVGSLHFSKVGGLNGRRPQDLGLPPWNKGKKGLQKGWNKGKATSETTKKKQSDVKKRRLKVDSQFYTTLTNRLLTQAHPRLKDPEVQGRRFRAIIKKPNHKEEKLIRLFERYSLPFKYVGDGELLIACKCPDFINTENGKQLIELFGNYWHKQAEVEERERTFAQYGFQTLIIWENELENEDHVLERVKSFMLTSTAENSAQAAGTSAQIIKFFRA